MDLGRVGLWTFALRGLEGDALRDTVAEVEQLGYGTIWFPGRGVETSLAHARQLLEASSTVKIATGIVSIWASDVETTVAGTAELEAAHPGRFVLGLGVSHPEAVNRAEPDRYQRPILAMTHFLDELDASGQVPKERRVLAALGPRMLRLVSERAAGAHPYFVPVEHTAFAREALGAGPLLAPEQAVVLETDPERARTLARSHMQLYLQLVNYTSNLKRFGFTDADMAGGGSDRLVDAIVAWGDAEAIAARVRAHHGAGADHVCLQVLSDEPMTPPLADWRTLAAAVGG